MSEVCRHIRVAVDKWGAITVRGEVTGFKRQQSGHWYFLLKDSAASVRCVVFASDARFIHWDDHNEESPLLLPLQSSLAIIRPSPDMNNITHSNHDLRQKDDL